MVRRGGGRTPRRTHAVRGWNRRRCPRRPPGLPSAHRGWHGAVPRGRLDRDAPGRSGPRPWRPERVSAGAWTASAGGRRFSPGARAGPSDAARPRRNRPRRNPGGAGMTCDSIAYSYLFFKVAGGGGCAAASMPSVPGSAARRSPQPRRLAAIVLAACDLGAAASAEVAFHRRRSAIASCAAGAQRSISTLMAISERSRSGWSLLSTTYSSSHCVMPGLGVTTTS
jgi:hypothetical protein